MSSNEIETNGVNGSQLAEQGPSSGRCSRQGNIGCHHANLVIIKRRKWTSQENKIVMECCLLLEPKIRGYRKHMLSLWLQKCMFWVSEIKSSDKLGKIVHWKFARKCKSGDKWYKHEPESVLENEDYKILWDFSIQTDHVKLGDQIWL